MGYWAAAPIPRKQIVLFAPTLDSAIPENHPVRLFEEILWGLRWEIWEAEYDGTRGQPPIHSCQGVNHWVYQCTKENM